MLTPAKVIALANGKEQVKLIFSNTGLMTGYKVDVDDIIEAADLFMDSKKSAAMFKENDPNSKFIV